MKIFITGCAKSGTTLLRRLFNAFEVSVCNDREISLKDFIESSYEVGKRTHNSIFSSELYAPDVKKQLKLIKNNDVKVVNIIRDKDQVLASDHGYVSESRYYESVAQAFYYHDYIVTTVYYSELISNPDQVQQVLAKKLGLKILHKFSEYPNFIDASQETTITGLNMELRPIGAPYK